MKHGCVCLNGLYSTLIENSIKRDKLNNLLMP